MNLGHMCCAAVLLTLSESGCVSIPMDDLDQYKTVETPNFRQVTAVSVDRIEPELIRNGDAAYKFKLHAVGEFIEHGGCKTESANIGRRTLTIGFWPGAALDSEEDTGALVVASLVANTLLVGIPTISSLLLEPFRDYSVNSPRYSVSKPQKDVYLADVGLIGFRKHYRVRKRKNVEGRTGFRETGHKNCSRVELYGFAVTVNGSRCNSVADGSVLLQGVTSGERIHVKIVGAPSVNNDSADRMTELVGTEFELIVP